MDIIFLHGLESGPNGSKIQSIRADGYSLTVPDCEGVDDVRERVEIARRALAEAEGPVVMVGSSFGGLTAALLLSELAGSAEAAKVKGLLLLAPAFHLVEAESIKTLPPNTAILHGIQDTVVPIVTSRAFCAQNGCAMVQVEDDHRLRASHPQILALLKRIVGGLTP